MTKYRAFLSYRHGGEDGAFGAKLHRDLERYRVPRDLVGRQTPFGLVPTRLAPIFRDRDDFHAGEALRAQTLAALQDAEALVVVCSPRAVESLYIGAEIEEFVKLGRGGRIIPIILSGEPKDPALTPFPPALLADGRELIAADARAEGDGYELAKLKVIAGLIGVKLDDLRKREAQAQRRRMLAFGSAAVVFATLSVATAGLAWLAEQRRQMAERNFQVAKGAAESLVFDIAQGLRNVEGMRAETVAKILGTAEQSIDTLVREASEDSELRNLQHVMLDEFAKTYQTQGDTARAMGAAQRSLSIVAKLAELEPWDPRWRRALSVSHERISDVLRAQGDGPRALASYRKALVIAEALTALDPGNTTWQRDLYRSHFRLAAGAMAQGDSTEALAAARRAEAIAVRLTTKDPLNTLWQQDLAYSHTQIGDVQVAQGDGLGALAAYRKGLAIAESLVTRDPQNTAWQRDLCISYERVGDMLLATGDLKAARVEYEKALRISEALTQKDPNNTLWQQDLARYFARIGDVLAPQGDASGALSVYRKGLALAEALVERDPQNTAWQQDLASTLARIGRVLLAVGDTTAAIEAFTRNHGITEKLWKNDRSSSAIWLGDYAASHGLVGQAFVAARRPGEALAMFEKGRALVAPLAARSVNMQWKESLQLFDQEIAKLRDPLTLLAQQVAAAFARKDYNNTFSLQNELAAAVIAAETTANGRPGSNSANALGTLAFYAVLAREPTMALEAADKALALTPDTLWIEANRASALMLLGQTEKALTLYLAHRGKTIPGDEKAWEAVILADFATLREAGITHPQMAEIEAAFNVPAR